MGLTLKNIALKLLSFVILLVIISWIYNVFFYKKDLSKHSDLVSLIHKIPTGTDILYVAESSNTALHPDDSIKKTIAEFLDDAIPDQKISDLTKPAAHAGIYKELLKAIPSNSQIKTIIVTLNLRSFNAQWIHSSLETALQKSAIFLRPNPPIINRFLLSFKDFEIKSETAQEAAFKAKWKADIFHFPYAFAHKNVIEWDNWMAIEGVKNEDGSKNQPLTELACHFIKGYGFQIDTLTNPRIADFNEIIDIAEGRGWKLIFNLLAENVEKADELVGKNLTFLMEENRDLLINYYTRRGVIVVDNLEQIPSDYFIDQNWTTEHYSDAGRKKIANNIANIINAKAE